VGRLGDRNGFAIEVIVGIGLHQKGSFVGFHLPPESERVRDMAVRFFASLDRASGHEPSSSVLPNPTAIRRRRISWTRPAQRCC
jgi:hypothetical protein